MDGVEIKASDIKAAKRLRLSKDEASIRVLNDDGSVSRSFSMEISEEFDIKLTMKRPFQYDVNTKVLCQYTDSNFYEAKIIKVVYDGLGNPRYTIHYIGWNARHDEVICHEEAITRFTEYNKKNLEFAIRSRQNAKKSRKSIVKDQSSKSGRRSVNSRSTGTLTPSLDQIIESVIERRIEDVEPEPPIVVPIKTKALCPNIPEEINNLLVKDSENVTSNKLLKLPARKTLSDIFDEFLKAYQDKKTRPKDIMEGRVKMLKSCLNCNLQLRLLYKFEQIQFLNELNSLRKQSGLPKITPKEFFQELNEGDESTVESEGSDDDSEKPNDSKKKSSKTDLANIDAKSFVPDFTTIYGPMIFFRFCSYAPTMLEQDFLSVNVSDYMVIVLNDVMEFIYGKLDEYFDPNFEYENASSDYIREIDTFV